MHSMSSRMVGSEALTPSEVEPDTIPVEAVGSVGSVVMPVSSDVGAEVEPVVLADESESEAAPDVDAVVVCAPELEPVPVWVGEPESVPDDPLSPLPSVSKLHAAATSPANNHLACLIVASIVALLAARRHGAGLAAVDEPTVNA
jgi:hypothetical protein